MSDTLPHVDFLARLAALEADNKRIHESRHEANARVIEVIEQERISRMELEQTVTSVAKSVADLTSTVKDLVTAMGGGAFGQSGLVAQVAAIQASIATMQAEARQYREQLDAKLNEGRGMLRLAAWGGAILGAFATIRGLFSGN